MSERIKGLIEKYGSEIFNPENFEYVFTGNPNLGPGEEFEHLGVKYVSITGAIGYKREIFPGVTVDAGMLNDPEYPLPDGTITAVRVGEETVG